MSNDAPPRPGTEELDAWRDVMHLMERLSAALDAHLRRHCGLSLVEYDVLAALSEVDDGTVGMSVLTGLTYTELSRLSHLMTRLEVRGLARRERDRRNGRAMNAVITAAGLDRVRHAAPRHLAEMRRLVSDTLAPSDVHALELITDRVDGRLGTG